MDIESVKNLLRVNDMCDMIRLHREYNKTEADCKKSFRVGIVGNRKGYHEQKIKSVFGYISYKSFGAGGCSRKDG
jgi:hypothetical protein